MDDEAHVEPEGEGPTTCMLQIREPDLAELERLLPLIHEAVAPAMTNRTRVHLRRVKQIISDIRWNYGPWLECHEVPFNE